jgi:signal transduction histidine kinase
MSAHKLLPLLALALNLLLLGSALSVDRRSRRTVVFALLAGGLAVWNLGVFGLRSTVDPVVALRWQYFLHAGVIPVPVLFYHYVVAFLDLRERRGLLVAGYTLGAVFLAVSPAPAFLAGVQQTSWGFAAAPGPLYLPFVLYVHAYLVIGLVRLMAAYRTQASSVRRNRTLLVIWGTAVSLAGGLVDFLRIVLDWDALYPLGIPTNAFFALALGVAIVRYRLMDIGALVKRALLYLLTAAALAPAVFAGVWGAHELLPERGPETDITRDAVVLVLLVAAALPLLRRLELALEQLMFRREHGVREALVEMSKALPAIIDRDQLARALTEGLVARIPALHATLHLPGPGGRFAVAHRAVSPVADAVPADASLDERVVLWLRMSGRTLAVDDSSIAGAPSARLRAALAGLERDQVALVVPLAEDDVEPAAILVLGEKVSGDVYTSAETELLETLAREAGIALRNARLYLDLREQMDALRRTQDQLVQSAKLAAVGELAAGVAHELNSPLMVISGHAQLLLRQQAADASGCAALGTIVEEAHRAAGIIRNMLDFSRRREITRTHVSLEEIIDRALALLEARLERGGIQVARIYGGDVAAVDADRDRLTQVLINLLANAADAMASGGVVTVETAARESAEGAWSVVSVRDTGSGMSEETVAHVFEAFFTTKPEGAGTGLGLSVSLDIIRQHGGMIEVESRPGTGTTMRVVLPVAGAAPAPLLTE